MSNERSDGVDLTPASWGGSDEVVIVGGGLAGLFCALKLSPRPVTILSPTPIGRGASSAWAQGGIAAAVSEGDTPKSHASDTIAAGDGLVDKRVAHLLAREAPERVEDLLRYGVPFDRDLEGRLAVSREAAHSERRVVHVRGDMAGKAIMEALVAAVRAQPSIRVIEGLEAISLLSDGRYVTGVTVRRGTETVRVPARATVLATGGIGHLYAVTTNPPQSSGHGLAMAAVAGAVIADPEFVQFHPTAIDVGLDPAPLATEALRGDGAVLIDGRGERFMMRVHPLGDLAPRDVVARAVHAQIARGEGAFLDCREAIGAHFPDAFPKVYASCRAAGLDPVTQPIPIAPAAHYHMGGVMTDVNGRSSLDGLWACGEVACTGAHGANRLASNSLLEAVVFAGRAALDIDGMLPHHRIGLWRETEPMPAAEPLDNESVAALRGVMTRHVGVVRSAEGMTRALERIADIERAGISRRLRNMAVAARIVTWAALRREESRGGHFRSDFPEPDPKLAQRTYLRLADIERELASAA